jgi:hypothetical protein
LALDTAPELPETMSKRPKRGLHTAAIAAVFASVAAVQYAAAQVSVDVSNCVELTKPEERLACFEAQVEAARNAPAEAPPAAAPAAPAASAAPAAPAAPDAKDERPADIIARVAALRETVPNASLITLDNGQVWRQTVPQYYPLRPGSDVRVYYSRWRAYRLTSPSLRGHIQVERVR